MLSSVLRVRAKAALLLLLVTASPVDAQPTDPDFQPVGRFAADARVVFAGYPKDPGLAEFLDVTEEHLATRGLGLVFGAHVYPLRLGRYVTLGLGGELLFSRGSKTFSTDTDEDEDAADGPTVTARLSAVSPQFSLNFGGRDGWSYLSGGIGWTKFSSEVKGEAPGVPGAEDTPRASTINYGGGARWFMKKHLALSLDLRFYAIRPQVGTATRPALQRTRLVMLNAGVGFK